MKRQPCALIIVKYASHVYESTLSAADELKIRLLFIPTSATDMLQPLDIRIFGSLKAATIPINQIPGKIPNL